MEGLDDLIKEQVRGAQGPRISMNVNFILLSCHAASVE